MKILFTTVLLVILVSNYAYNQYHYELTVSYLNSSTTPKDLTTAIRLNNIECFNVHHNENKIEFDTYSDLTQGTIAYYIKDYAQIESYLRTKPLNHYNHSDQKFGGVNCSNAGQICSNNTVTGNNSGYGTQELNSTNRGCLSSNEHQSSWYYINIGSAGTLTMWIQTFIDYDFAIWGPYTAANAQANCPPLSSPIRCSYSANYGYTGINSQALGYTITDQTENASGDAWVQHLTVSPGQVYILLVDNYTADNSPYTINWGGTAMLDCTPILLAADISYFDGLTMENENVLTWATENEFNHNHFEVYHSTNGEGWNLIDEVAAKGSYSNYSINHTNYSKENYYRLVSVDTDGSKRVYEQIVFLRNDVLEIESIHNLMGQPVDSNYKGLVIIRYKDGTSEKVYR